MRVHEFGAQTIDIVVVTLDGQYDATEDGRHGDLGLFEVGGDHRHAGPAQRGGVGRNGCGQVARGGTSGSGEAELASRRKSAGHDAVLKRSSWIAGVVLQPEF